MKVVLFSNFSSERFASPNHTTAPGLDEHCQWDKTPYSFEPGQSVYLEVGVASTMAKHLITRECYKNGLDSIRGYAKEGKPDPIGDKRITKTIVEEMQERCLGEEIIEVATPMEMFELTRALVEAGLDKVEEKEEPKKEDKPEGKACCGALGNRHKAACKGVVSEEAQLEVKDEKEEEFEGLNK